MGKQRKRKPQQGKSGAAGANSQGGQDAAAAAADEYRAAREWLLSKNFRVQTWATHKGGEEAVVSFGAVAAMAKALADLQKKDAPGTRLLFAEPPEWSAARAALVGEIEGTSCDSDTLTALSPRYVFPNADGTLEYVCNDSHELMSRWDTELDAVDSGHIVREAEAVRTATVRRAAACAAPPTTPTVTVGELRLDVDRGGMVVPPTATVPSPRQSWKSVWPGGARELIDEWQTRIKRIEDLTEEYGRHRDRVCLGTTVRGKPSSYLDDHDENERGLHPHSVKNMLKDIRSVATTCRHQTNLDSLGHQAFMKKDGSAEARAEMAQEYGEKRKRLEVVEMQLERQASSRSQQEGDERRGDEIGGESDSKRAAFRRRQARRGVGVGVSEPGNSAILARHEKASREYEDVLLRTLGRMSSVAVRHARQAEVRELNERLDKLLHNLFISLDSKIGAVTTCITNEQVISLLEDSTLHDFFENEAQWVVVTASRLSVELHRKEVLLDRLREDPLLAAVYCAVQCELDSHAQRQREIDAETALQELLQEEQDRAIAHAKVDTRSRRRHTRQDDTTCGQEQATLAPTADPHLTGEKTTPPVTSVTSETPLSTTAAVATPIIRKAKKGAENAKAKSASAVGGRKGDAVAPSAQRAVAPRPSAGTVTKVLVEAEDPWEVSAKKVKLRAGKGRQESAGSGKDAAASVAAAVPCHLMTPTGELVPVRGQVCRLFLRGECSSPQCDKLHPQGRVGCSVACDYFLVGRCTRGKQCRYAHPGAAALAQAQAAGIVAAPGVSAGSVASRARRDAPIVSTAAAPTSKSNHVSSVKPAAPVARGVPACTTTVVSDVVESAGQVPRLSALNLVLSLPSVRAMLLGMPTHTHAANGACVVCALARMASKWGDDGRAVLADPAPDFHEALDAALPAGKIDVLGATIALLDLLRLLLESANANHREESAVGRLFGVCIGEAGVAERVWTLALDASLRNAAGPRMHALLATVTLVRIVGWAPDHWDWLISVLHGKLSQPALLASLGFDTPVDDPTTVAPRLTGILVEHAKLGGSGVVWISGRGRGSAVLWTNQITRICSEDASDLLKSLLISSRWRVVALVLSR